jgi:hypothetical protein
MNDSIDNAPLTELSDPGVCDGRSRLEEGGVGAPLRREASS